MAPEEQTAQVAVLIDEFVLFQHTIDPARHGHAGLTHHAGRVLRLDPVEFHAPGLGEVFPGALRQTIVARQRIRVGADVGRALHIVVTTENVGTTAALAHIAQGELQQARCPHHRVAGRVLGLSHAPDDRAGTILGHGLGHPVGRRFIDPTGFEHGLRRPLGHDFSLDLVHAPDPVFDVLLVFPAVLEDVVHHPKQERNVSA